MTIRKHVLAFLDIFHIISVHGCLQPICVQVLEEMFQMFSFESHNQELQPVGPLLLCS